ncbi:MAG TPA: hypothetical protein VJ991_12075, partial [Balneolales bacterium]|nr:hypothetical protein [Balneolales bacterium]
PGRLEMKVPGAIYMFWYIIPTIPNAVPPRITSQSHSDHPPTLSFRPTWRNPQRQLPFISKLRNKKSPVHKRTGLKSVTTHPIFVDP